MKASRTPNTVATVAAPAEILKEFHRARPVSSVSKRVVAKLSSVKLARETSPWSREKAEITIPEIGTKNITTARTMSPRRIGNRQDPRSTKLERAVFPEITAKRLRFAIQ